MINSVKTSRFEEMDEVGGLMVRELKVLQTIFQELRIFEGDPVDEYCLQFVREKIGNKPLRAYFFQKMHMYLVYDEQNQIKLAKYEKKLLLTKLPFIFEIVICIQYLHNHILDEKYDSNAANHIKLCRNLTVSNILREVLFTYINQEIQPLLPSSKEYEYLLEAVRRVFLYVDLGQRIDKEYTNYRMFKEGIPTVKPRTTIFDELMHSSIDDAIAEVKQDGVKEMAFVEAYFYRIYLTNVFLFRTMTEVLIEFAQPNQKEKRQLLLFTVQYGFMLQIINDYGDFAYAKEEDVQRDLQTVAKKSTDVFSDLANANITLPLIYHLQEDARRLINSYLMGKNKKRNVLHQYPLQVMQEIVNSGAIKRTVKITKNLSKSAISYLDNLNPVYPYFKDMCDMAYINKYKRILK